MSDNFYKILCCSETSSYEEIKRNYQQLAKEHHPDKQSSNYLSDKFLKIDEAWKTLRDKELRKRYDALLTQKKFNEQYLVYATLNLSELECDHNNQSFYPCRCGYCYVIDKNVIIDECVIECEECSYVIIVVNK